MSPEKIKVAIVASMAVVIFALVAAPGASAGTVDCEQYPNDPDCVGDVGPIDGGSGDDDGNLPDFGGGNNGPGGGFGDGDGLGNGSGTGDLGDGDGKLPFTGYPVTPLVILILALIAAGLLVRTYVAVRERLRAGTTKF